jgi:hypothetical protein
MEFWKSTRIEAEESLKAFVLAVFNGGLRTKISQDDAAKVSQLARITNYL